MKIPYNEVHAVGDLLFAARGGKIHTFSLIDGSFISTWKHPDLTKSTGDDISSDAVNAEQDTPMPAAENEPPLKRQRIDEGGSDGKNGDAEQVETEAQGNNNEQPNKPKGKSKKPKAGSGTASRIPRPSEMPVVAHITSAQDGKYVLAITSHDKAIWVFENNGSGHLKQLSQR